MPARHRRGACRLGRYRHRHGRSCRRAAWTPPGSAVIAFRKADALVAGFQDDGCGSALVDVAEQAEAMAAAASSTGHKLLLDIFGSGTGGRLAFGAAVIPLPKPVPRTRCVAGSGLAG